MPGAAVRVLLLNAGSSSLKATLVEAGGGGVLAHASADWAGPVARPGSPARVVVIAAREDVTVLREVMVGRPAPAGAAR